MFLRRPILEKSRGVYLICACGLFFSSKREIATPRGLARLAWLGVRNDTHFIIFLGYIGKADHCPASRRDATQSPLIGVRKLVAQKRN